MKTIHVICEGQTEAKFVMEILWPQFDYSDYIFVPEILLTKNDIRKGKMYKGGISTFKKAENSIRKALNSAKGKKDMFVTTMFDFYGLPQDTPGMDECKKLSDAYKKVELIEDSIKVGFYDAPSFLPYIQLHEFETLLFADLDILKETYFDNPADFDELYTCVTEFNNIELINGGTETAPSKRLKKCIPHYDKTVLGIAALKKVRFDTMREKCRHFDDWVHKIESL